MADNDYDIVILGGGTGGYSAAFRARELGLTVALVERAKLGGTCLHKGCIPTKSLLQAANLLETVRRAPSFGLEVTGSFDWSKVKAKKEETVGQIYSGLRSLAGSHGVDIHQGTGRLDANETVTVASDGGSEVLRFKNAILATGSKPRILPGLEPNGTILSSDEALDLDHVPGSVIVVGGGYIGVEFASLWRSFGVDVTIAEMAPRLMVQEEEEISRALAQALVDRGIKLHLDTAVKPVETDSGVRVAIETRGESATLEADKLLVAIGRVAVTDSFDNAGVTLERGFVKTNERLRTSRPAVYAVGDVLPSVQLAHAAFAEGIFAAEEIAGLNPDTINYDAIPHAAYCHPEVAAVGLTEAQARDRGYEVSVVRESFGANARARIAGEPEGQIKIVAQTGGPVLGIHMIGPGVSELAAEAMLIIGWEADAQDIARFIHPHPTLSEAIGEAALKLAGKPLHSL